MNELISILKSAAPAVATALAGPVGGLVVSKIADKLGVDADASAIVQAISTNPEALAKVKELELEYFKVEASDRDSARKRESEIATTGPWYSKIVTPLLALGVASAWVTIQWFLMHHTIQSEMREIIIRVLGNLDAAFMMVLSYYFGASHKH